ncbi:MAG TPA: NAD(P)/FAD-dependent oxidoreductase [Dehalococcoidia bacterium]|nr:NAD(P)/FAD-dependent oxidoreductase [Dehalococcoidia bacterium]
MIDPEVYDLTIIGAGPTGLFSAFYAGLRGMKTKIIESLPEAGGQLAVLYPEKFIYDVPGFPKILAKDLVPQLIEQCSLFQPKYIFEERIETLTRTHAGDEEVWRLGNAFNAHLSRTVLISAGVGAFAPNRLDRPGVDEFEGKGVYYFVKDKRPFRNKKMLIVGGGDTAIDWCLNLKDWASEITLVHRRDEFRAHEASIAAVRHSGIPMRTFWELKRVVGEEGVVTSATIYNNKTGEEEELQVDVVLLSLGFKASLGPIEGWGMELADQRHVQVDGFMQTNLEGVFAAGDIAAVEGSEPLNLIVTGFAQGAIAANAAKRHLDPKSRLFPGHSSELRL